MRSRFQFLIFFLTLLLVPAVTWTQKASREDYISTYNKLAIDEMKRSGIPASVTLAQGLLESDNGNSTLATRGNNHFGIKCHDWKGKKIFHDDDKKNECFRKYKTVKESYVDHTDFLMGSPRYSFLFEMDHNDYKGWSKGLKKAGYATSPKYSDLLIRIIEENELDHFDSGKIRRRKADDTETIPEVTDIDGFEIEIDHRKILMRNRIDYIIVKEEDTYQSLTGELEMMPYELAQYNEIPRDSKLKKGQVLYLQPKRGKASVEFSYHMVEAGETMYDISQMYGIKLKKLYQLNLMDPGEEPEPSDEIHLRKKKKPPAPEPVTDSVG
ncbi:MAG: glucosaminidase domain-containing protein [Bacteroidales bacterium]|nr:glucosaminidase domain-containing protein [Bacteroidales bacterium]